MIKNLSYIFFVLIMLSCGSETKKNLVTDIKKEGQDNSTDIYKTEYFKVDLTITGYKHALTKNGLFTFNEDGNYESVNNVSNTIVIGRLPKMSEIEKKEFIENLKPKGEHQLEEIKDSEIVTTKIGDYSASIMDTEIKFDNDDEGVLYWVILNDDESSLAFMCQAYGTERQEFLQKYKETAKTLKLE